MARWHIEALVTRDGVERWVLIGKDYDEKRAQQSADRYRATGRFEAVRVRDDEDLLAGWDLNGYSLGGFNE